MTADLIASCRARLAAAGENPATDPLFDYAVWAVETMPALLDALEAAEFVRNEYRDMARERRDEIVCLRADLEKAQLENADREQHMDSMGDQIAGLEFETVQQLRRERDAARAALGRLMADTRADYVAIAAKQQRDAQRFEDLGRQYEGALTEIGDKGARIIALRAAIDGLQDAQRPLLGIEAALEYAWDDGNASGLDGWTGPGRGAGEVDQQAIYNRDRAIRTALEKLGETPRPPLGYVAVYVEDGRPVRVAEKGTVFADRDTAAFYAVEDSTLALLEVREVQP